MQNNYDLLMGFRDLRDFAICASKNGICCHKKSIESYDCYEHNTEDDCRRCWLDFLTNDKGLDLSYLEKEEEPLIRKTPSPIRLTEKSMQILKEKKNENQK